MARMKTTNKTRVHQTPNYPLSTVIKTTGSPASTCTKEWMPFRQTAATLTIKTTTMVDSTTQMDHTNCKETLALLRQEAAMIT